MPKMRMVKSVLCEYGMGWAVNRARYSAKLKMLRLAPVIEKRYEKKPDYPKRLDLFQINNDALKSFLCEKLNTDEKNKLIRIADRACEGIIIGFSSIELNYGNPIDWQLNPLTGKRCNDKEKWYLIPDFDQERGDIKAIWEASRFSHFITLSRAFLLTDDEKYYKTFSLQLKDWLKRNSYGYGANFKCGQECSLRMVNALLAYTVFRNHGLVTDADTSNVKDLVDRCYRKILSNFFYAYKCIKNNHTISELMGMIVGAWCCCDQKQLVRAYRLLDEVIDEQFTDDGGYRQFSFNYQRLALQDLEVVLSISSQTGQELNSKSKEKIQNATLLMYQCQDETGDMPNYGSNDGALVFPVTSCSYRDFRPTINATYALITKKQLYDPGKHQEEIIWFSCGREIQDCKTEKRERVSSQFDHAGLFILRNDNSWAMIISNEFHTRPAHMDQLHFDLWIDGVNVLCDAGTFSYASEEGRKLSRNENHNTVFVKGKAQMNSSGPFMIYDWTKRSLGYCDESGFSGTMVSVNGYTHVREVKQIGASYEITDKVDKDYTVFFHTPCEVTLIGNKAILFENGRKLCEIMTSGKMELQKTIRSLYYLKTEKTNCLSISGQAETSITTTIKTKGENTND